MRPRRDFADAAIRIAALPLYDRRFYEVLSDAAAEVFAAPLAFVEPTGALV